MAEHDRSDAPRRPHVALEAHECKQRAENPELPTTERLVWAMLAVAAELHIIRKEIRKGQRPGRGG
ncbi:hypothetical protein SSP24_06100 [Streptomyces spinoverrucosus]|uniref:Uncharacterized protein n=1 Tax=Streptomyces spinoverrucosus TaxID=284043 RepID=A0A4Y3V986_9ACTN|nr:hypothetical protein [Streptomyces spinoverrucosus]GEC02955.1 hypothetical protein SSP24_06100 [Streptomyces spinoverrucosus]GHB39313.1 hypothetical protein GCM10010397_06490 [Streptomyces spinoverrucosus]